MKRDMFNGHGKMTLRGDLQGRITTKLHIMLFNLNQPDSVYNLFSLSGVIYDPKI